MNKKESLEKIFSHYALTDFKWMKASEIIVSNWVRVKCTFGCSDYGSSVCPPNVPGVKECREFFNEYTEAVIFRFNFMADKEKYPKNLSQGMTKKLLDIEREVFLQGFQKAFILNQTGCGLCQNCTKTRTECKNLAKSRPSPEAFAIDVFSTVRKVGFEIDVVTKSHQEINRYAILLIE